MNKLEIFMDVSCPFCRQGFAYLTELLPSYPSVELDWRFVEAHPRNEEPLHRPYVDLAVQGGLYFKAKGLDECAYAARLMKAVHEDRSDVEDHAVLVKCAAELGADADEFAAALNSGEYASAQLAANDYAYETQKVWAVPTFVCGEKRLDAVGGVGVTKEQLKSLLDAIA